jgi:aspartate aminotransferase-like enzyme
MQKLLFKEADNPRELQQIHALNHRVFSEEIAQHPTNPSGLLIDRFHGRNRYFVALHHDTVIGMISIHAGPDFSIARRLPDPDVLRTLSRPFEIRLLAIEPQARNRTVLAGLLWQVYDFARSQEGSHLLISGIIERESMYRKLGFVPLGPAVPDGSARFIPMMMPLVDDRPNILSRVELHRRHWHRSIVNPTPISLLPGPVNIHPRVAQSFSSFPVSHRSANFIECFEDVQGHLQALVPEMEVTLFPGAGTLANDAVAANLKALFGAEEGLVLSNGEFGERLIGQASGSGLSFRHLRFPWGTPWSLPAVEEAMKKRPAWLWAVHLETSTGTVNDVKPLLAIARLSGSVVALDCVSSLGAVPIASEAGPLFLASGVSGKSLGSYAGLAFVFVSKTCKSLLAGKTLCTSFDLLNMLRTRGPVSTVPSPSLFALACALQEHYGSSASIRHRFQDYSSLGKYVRRELRAIGIEPLVPDEIAAPNITTFVLPTASFSSRCLAAGYQIASESNYLRARNWGQIATMGDITTPSLERLFQIFRAPVGNVS